MPFPCWWYAWFRGDGEVEGLAPTTPTNVPRDELYTVPGNPHAWAAQACALADGTMSRADWTRYFGSLPYRNVCPASR